MPQSPESPSRQDSATISVRQLADRRFPELPKPTNYPQLLGAKMAKTILAVIIAVSVLIWSRWALTVPTIADAKSILPSNAPSDEVMKILKTLQSEHFATFRSIFDLLILSCFMSLFTLVAGYAFGARDAEKGGNGS